MKEEDNEAIIKAFVKTMINDPVGWSNEAMGQNTALLIKILHELEYKKEIKNR